MKRKSLLITVFLLIISAHRIYGAEKIIIDDETKKTAIGTYLEIFDDAVKKESITTITSTTLPGGFVKSNDPIPSMGFTDSAIWVRFTIENRSRSFNSLLLELAYPLMDNIVLYESKDDGSFTQKKTAGYRQPFIQRELKNKNFIFKLNIPAGKTRAYYMRFVNEDRMELPLTLYTPDSFYEKDHIEQYIMGIFYGLFIVMFLYNFFLYFFIRDKSYLYYIFFIFAYGFFQLTQNGYAYEFFIPRIFEKYSHYIPLSISLALISIVLFSISYLNVKARVPRLYRYYLIILALLGINIFLPLVIKYSTCIQISALLSILTISSVMVTGITSYLKRYRPALFFMVAWSVFLIGSIIYALRVLKVIPANSVTYYTMQIGSAIQLILLSLGLGDRITIMRKEKRIADKEIAQANTLIMLSEQKYKSIVESSADIIFSLDENLNFISANKAIKTHLRISPDSIGRINFIDIIYENTESGSTESFASQMVREKINQLKETKEKVNFNVELFSKMLNEPKEMNITLELIEIEGKNEILGRAASAYDDTLLKNFTSEKQLYTIGNYLTTAEEISYRATKNLRKYMKSRELNMIRLSLREMIINAIEHGNLGITYAEKTESLKSDRNGYFDLVNRRQRDPMNIDKKVEIEYLISQEKAVYKITDEGKGFDYSSFINTDMSQLNHEMMTHGRGISLARSIFDDIQYNKKGNQVMLTKIL